jgi:hypothetical protein
MGKASSVEHCLERSFALTSVRKLQFIGWNTNSKLSVEIGSLFSDLLFSVPSPISSGPFYQLKGILVLFLLLFLTLSDKSN